ncbi:MAG: diacylglycerol kinase family protein [Eubacteriaceae bacterium]|jgi:diacylglycerol kinase
MHRSSGEEEHNYRIIQYADKTREEQDQLTSSQTGPINSELIRKMTENQKRQTELNAKQKKKHERDIAYAENEPIRIGRLKKSFGYAFQGLWYVVKTQPNMKIHLIMGTIAVLLGFFFHISRSEWLAVILVIGFVITLEVINTAIETLVDLYTEDFSFLAGVSKDLGATTVLIMAITSVVVGCVVFLPKIWAMCVTLFGW